MEKQQRLLILRAGSCITNERGVAIIAALLILMLLSFVAITSTTTVTTEKRMVRSQTVFEKNFYLAESAALEGIQKLANQPNDQTDELLAKWTVSGTSDNFDLLRFAEKEDFLSDIEVLDLVDDDVIDQNDLNQMADISDLNTQTHRFVIQSEGVDKPAATGPVTAAAAAGSIANSLVKGGGASGGTGSTSVYDYMSYGITTNFNGRSIVKIGYKRRVAD